VQQQKATDEMEKSQVPSTNEALLNEMIFHFCSKGYYKVWYLKSSVLGK
jgi:hypothetical protein